MLMVKKIRKAVINIFVSVLTFLSALFLSTNVAYADGKELTGVVTDISVPQHVGLQIGTRWYLSDCAIVQISSLFV